MVGEVSRRQLLIPLKTHIESGEVRCWDLNGDIFDLGKKGRVTVID